MKRAALTLGALLTSAAAFAAFSADSRGTSAATFLTLGGGARAAGMGGAQTAAAEGASSVIWNAAAPAGLSAPEIEAMRGDWFEGASYNFASAVVPFGHGLAASASYQQFGVGSLDGRDDSGFETGSFKPDDTALGLGFAGTAAGFQLGGLAKFIRSKIVSSASTAALDLGVMSPEENGRRWGVSATNLGGQLKYDAKGENLPLTVALGGLMHLGRHSLTADLKFPRDNNPYVAVGAEGVLPMGGGFEGRGRVGYSTRSGTDAGSLMGLSVGAGLRARWFSVDYAFAPYGDLGSVNVISLSLRGGGARP